MKNSFAVVVLTGGPPRFKYTAKCLESINSQSYTNIQKIIVNNGRPRNEFLKILDYSPTPTQIQDSSILNNWEIINLEINNYNPNDYSSVWKIPGTIALKKITSKYFFCINDDDFLDKDFFLHIDTLFNKYPDAISAFGLPLDFFWESEEVKLYKSKTLESRPECEDGLTLFRRAFTYEDSYHPNPGFSFVCLTEKVRPIAETFFSGGFPDYSPLIQIVPFGKTIFSKSSLMYLGRHSNQQRYTWDKENLMMNTYQRSYSDIVNINLIALNKLNKDNNFFQKIIKKYFKKVKFHMSFFILYGFVKELFTFQKNRQFSLNLKFLTFHIFCIISHPLMLLRIMLIEAGKIRVLNRFLKLIKL